ncbi:MAG: hypothetical protein KKA48_08405, partial [Proteobacteria bacterium]|nr:hypothetical protein [Pseudomonadota bacterium]
GANMIQGLLEKVYRQFPRPHHDPQQAGLQHRQIRDPRPEAAIAAEGSGFRTDWIPGREGGKRIANIFSKNFSLDNTPLI